jgi:hypothetical protein
MRILKFYRLLLLVTTIGGLLAPPAQAEDWFFLIEDAKDIKFFLDRDSIKRKGNFSEVRVLQVYPKTADDGTVAGFLIYEISCQEKKFRAKQINLLLNDQSIRVSREATEWNQIPVDTVIEKISQKVCNS